MYILKKKIYNHWLPEDFLVDSQKVITSKDYLKKKGTTAYIPTNHIINLGQECLSSWTSTFCNLKLNLCIPAYPINMTTTSY